MMPHKENGEKNRRTGFGRAEKKTRRKNPRKTRKKVIKNKILCKIEIAGDVRLRAAQTARGETIAFDYRKELSDSGHRKEGGRVSIRKPSARK